MLNFYLEVPTSPSSEEPTMKPTPVKFIADLPSLPPEPQTTEEDFYFEEDMVCYYDDEYITRRKRKGKVPLANLQTEEVTIPRHHTTEISSGFAKEGSPSEERQQTTSTQPESLTTTQKSSKRFFTIFRTKTVHKTVYKSSDQSSGSKNSPDAPGAPGAPGAKASDSKISTNESETVTLPATEVVTELVKFDLSGQTSGC